LGYIKASTSGLINFNHDFSLFPDWLAVLTCTRSGQTSSDNKGCNVKCSKCLCNSNR